MLGRWVTLQPVIRDWVPLDQISTALPRAVIASEDARFCNHQGVDWGALRSVIEDAGEDGPARGASTITMQVAKNLFLWPGAGYLRKPIEIVIAHWIDLVWPKRRIIEVYLNVVEWGPHGIFGAEASAQRAFGRHAANLSAQQAAIMTAALPNPVVRDPARPTRVQLRRAAGISARTADTSCISG
jgi:monofunctional biosynthetic peptidoglycan transglycosylase